MRRRWRLLAWPPRPPAPPPSDDDSDDPLAPKKPAQKPLGALWLRDWLVAASAGRADSHVAAAAARAVLAAAHAPSPPDALAADLLDLLGDTAIGAVQELVAVRKRLDAGLRGQIAAARAADAAAAGVSGPLGATVTIATAGERAAERAARKAARRVARGAAGSDPDAAWIGEHGVDGLAGAEADAAVGGGPDFVAAPGAAPASDARTALPAGTVRIVKKGYEELRVPPPAAVRRDEPLVSIDALPPWARAAFRGITHLNRIQSRIFATAFTTGVNLLVCAPTGAGKTNIAMLTVLREVGAAIGRGETGGGGAPASRGGGRPSTSTTIRPPSALDFKVVYVAPMKALAAEVTAAFSRRLAPLGLAVLELTGDMQLSRRELAATHMLVTTPEKWDVVTRKGGEGGSTAAAVRLLIIDEVHLLNDDRGAVVETIVARTHRCVEAAQRAIRVVGLSATLPNHRDVATFLGAPPSGVFHFDATYRPVPLETSFIGVHARAVAAARAAMDDIAFDKVLDSVRRGHQAMVFVHSRKDTGRTARSLATAAAARGVADAFSRTDHPRAGIAARDLAKSRNRELQEVAASGFGIHHAGMLRADRSLVERLFSNGHITVLVCTATLAWGVNLPAHTVVIRGTQLYNPSKGGFTNLGMLDVQQIFGRAGRPQFDDSGEAIIITPHDTLPHYLGLLTHSVPIESRLVPVLADALNAEVVLGSVASVVEGAAWLGYTYLSVRMARNPLAYGIPWAELASDPALEGHRRALITGAASELEEAGMARVDGESGAIAPTDLGRTASHYYVSVATVRVFNDRLKPDTGEADLLAAMARASEFASVAVREDEGGELDALARGACPFGTGAAAAAAAKAATSGGGGGGWQTHGPHVSRRRWSRWRPRRRRPRAQGRRRRPRRARRVARPRGQSQHPASSLHLARPPRLLLPHRRPQLCRRQRAPPVPGRVRRVCAVWVADRGRVRARAGHRL